MYTGAIVLTILLCLLSISAHELGHAWAMLKLRVPIYTISLLGIPIPRIPSLGFWFRFRGAKEETLISISPFIIGAYVEPDEEAFERLSPAESAFVAAAGPWASMLYSFLMLGITIIGATEISGVRAWDHFLFLPFPPYVSTYEDALLLCAGLGLALTLFRQYAYIPVFVYGTWMLIQLMDAILHRPLDSLGGPVSIAKIGTEIVSSNYGSIGIWIAPYTAGIISAFIGLANMLPMIPLDGGHVFRAGLRAAKMTRLAKLHTQVTITLFMVLVGLAFFRDGSLVWHHF